MTVPRFKIGQRVAYKPDDARGVVLAAHVIGERFPIATYLVQWDDGEPTDWAPGAALSAAQEEE